MIWKSLADVLENLENIETDFAEYRYRDSLVEQVRRFNNQQRPRLRSAPRWRSLEHSPQTPAGVGWS